MNQLFKTGMILYLLAIIPSLLQAQENSFSPEALQEDFNRFREILENDHCCLYEFTSKTEMDSLFDAHYALLDHEMERDEFYRLLAPLTARIGCMHTATWQPGRFFVTKPAMLFPLKIRLMEGMVISDGSYLAAEEIPRGSILLEINGMPLEQLVAQLRQTTSADALNPYFIDAQLTERFSLDFASYYGLPDGYKVKYLEPGKSEPEEKILTPADHESVRKVVYSKFNHPPLQFSINDDKNTAVMTVPTFIYYDRVDYFQNFMDSCFHLIRTKNIQNLVLDLRGNDGGDPFCSTVLLSYLQKRPVPYFSESYGRYNKLAEPLPMPEDHFEGNIYTLLDGHCGSTNGHFCALLKYHEIGKFVGTPGGASYKCNAGKNTELRLPNSQMILTIGRTTYAAAVKDMPKTAILPDIYVRETLEDYLAGRDVFIERAYEEIDRQHRQKENTYVTFPPE